MSWVERILRPRRWWTLDDRGVRRVMFNPNDRIVHMGTSEIDARAFAELRKQSGAEMTLWTGLLFFVIAGVMSELWHEGIKEIQATGRWSHYHTAAIPFTICVFVLTSRGLLGLWKKPGRFRATMLEMQRCPVCAYRLDGAPVAEDNCTLCPECGAAWKLELGANAAPQP